MTEERLKIDFLASQLSYDKTGFQAVVFTRSESHIGNAQKNLKSTVLYCIFQKQRF